MQLISREYVVAVAKRTDKDVRKLNFRRINNSRKFWVADPFPIEVDGTLYIFGEVFEYKKNKGSIGYTKLVDGKFIPWKIVIEEDFHLSFPYLFCENDCLYMCPEACASKQLYLYKCVEFPEKWEKDKVLIDNVNFSDTIFHKKNGTVYGFACIWNSIDKHKFKIFKVNDSCCEFSEGKVETLDFFLTRPAGKIFFDDNRPIMVSQICQPLYGSGLIFKEFDLNWPNYTERELSRVMPNEIKCDTNKKFIGMHTYNLTENYVVIDLIWERFSLWEKIYHLLRKLRK